MTQRGRRAVVMRLGFIGCEVSASVRQLGLEVDSVARFEGGAAVGLNRGGDPEDPKADGELWPRGNPA